METLVNPSKSLMDFDLGILKSFLYTSQEFPFKKKSFSSLHLTGGVFQTGPLDMYPQTATVNNPNSARRSHIGLYPNPTMAVSAACAVEGGMIRTQGTKW